MDRDHAQQAWHQGELIEARIAPVENANGWIILLANRSGRQITLCGHGGTQKVYHNLDQATAAVREIGCDTVRIEEAF
jgi:hypothetical protein